MINSLFKKEFIVEYLDTYSEQTDIQVLYEITKLGPFTVRKRIIDTEIVPTWAYIQQATLGHTDWRSKFINYM